MHTDAQSIHTFLHMPLFILVKPEHFCMWFCYEDLNFKSTGMIYIYEYLESLVQTKAAFLSQIYPVQELP